jgi:AhpD family alkylhydroperoxidase
LHKGPLGPQLVELVSLRISQINGCVFCLDMHCAALRKAGMDQRKLDTPGRLVGKPAVRCANAPRWVGLRR